MRENRPLCDENFMENRVLMGKENLAVMKRFCIGFVVIILAAVVLLFFHQTKNRTAVFSAPSNAQVVDAPDKDLHLYLWLDNGIAYYSVVYNQTEIVHASQMGLDTSIGDFSRDFQEIEMLSSKSQNTVWSPLVGEKSEIQDKYNEKVFRFAQQDNKSLSVEVRAYNTGVAFRYILPDASVYGNYTITAEQTRFSLSTKGVALCHENGQQQTAKKHRIQTIPKETNIHPPLTAEFDDGTAVTLAVSKLDNYAYPLLTKTREGLLKPIEQAVEVTENSPTASPYWTFVVGESLSDLPENKDIILNLNDAPDEEKYQYSQWVKPGKALMLGLFNETTESIKLQVDTAKTCGLDYLILDFGWYGPEFDEKSDPRLNPAKLTPNADDSAEIAAAKDFMRPYVPESGVFDASAKPFNVYDNCPWGGDIQMSPNISIPAIVDYAKTQGIGIFLYVNDVQLNDRLGRYDIDELFAQFSSWGVVGVKPGFVPDKSQKNEESTRKIIEIAAKYQLMLTVHDEWIQTGIEREYPNLLSAEGVFGDEGLSDKDIKGDINSLFARGVQGFTDHTICYPGKATRAYQLASSVLWPTGLNCVYWPWKNTDTNNRASIENLPEQERVFWKEMPADWDDLVVLKAEISKTAATARRTGDVWYVGAISGVAQTVSLSLDFLNSDTQYVAEIYYDRAGNTGKNSNRDNTGEKAKLLYAVYAVDSTTVIERKMQYGTGMAIRIRPATEGDERVAEYTRNALDS